MKWSIWQDSNEETRTASGETTLYLPKKVLKAGKMIEADVLSVFGVKNNDTNYVRIGIEIGGVVRWFKSGTPQNDGLKVIVTNHTLRLREGQRFVAYIKATTGDEKIVFSGNGKVWYLKKGQGILPTEE